ncbi:MAG: LPS export ABC transporter permease LptF [Acidobacteria bacterium]|nr:LPS export ABC transporter permease LptF [Acidobacteriota bacterium]
MPRLIDRYIIRSIVSPFLISLLVFTFILIMPFLVKLAEPLIAKGVAAGTIVRLMVTLLPQALSVTIPMALLVGVLVGLGRFSADREWVAVQACGVSIFRVARPVIILALAGWAVTSWVIIKALPDANQASREITFRIVAQRTESEVKPRVFFEDFPNRVLYVRDIPKDGSGWRDVFLADTTVAANPVVYIASRGRLFVDREKRMVELYLEDGSTHTGKAGAPEEYDISRFQQLHLTLDPETVFPRNGPQKGAQEMTITELRQQVEELARRGISTHAEVMAIQQKFSIPVACLVFAMMGVALGLTTRRDGKLAGFVLGIAVIFVYYLLLTTAQSAVKGKLMAAWLAPWVPNIVLGGAGIALLLARGATLRRWRSIVGKLTRLAGRLGSFRWLAVLSGRRPEADDSGGWVPRAKRSARGWTPRGATILDAYLGRTYLGVFAVTFSGLVAIFYVSTFIELSEKLFKGQATVQTLIEYLYWATPQFVYFCIPLAVLIGGLVTIGLLTRSSELVVMRACGISLYRTTVPLALFALLAGGALFLLEERVLAPSNKRADALLHVIRGGSPLTFDIGNRKWLVAKNGDIYNYVFFDAQRNELDVLSVFRFAGKAWRIQSRSFFRTASFSGHATGREDLVAWDGKDGWTREFDRRVEERSFRPVPSASFQMEPPQFFVTEPVDADRMTYGQLKRYIAEMRTVGFNVVKDEVALHRKVSFPWVTLIMMLIAVPFAVTTGRRGAMYGIGLGIALAVVYRIADSVFGALGTGGLIMPMLAAWSANILFAAVAIYLLLTVRT